MKNPQRLIGKKVLGFKFEDIGSIRYDEIMDKYIGKIGEVTKTYKDKTCRVDFEDDYYFYPTDQIEANLVEDEIPTLSDGVMMLVRNDDEKEWFSRKVIGKKGLFYYYWHDDIICKMSQCKPLDPTKEEQLTAILGSSEKVSEIMELFKDKK